MQKLLVRPFNLKAMTNLTELQRKLLEYYKQYRKEHNTHPRLSVVAKHFKVSPQAISVRCYTLVKQGYFTSPYDGAFIPTKKK